MPKRKASGAGPSSAQSFDAQRFKSAVHAKRFEENVIKRSIVREKGFDLIPGKYPRIETQIQRRHWWTFCGNPGQSSLGIVKEFYANAFLAEGEETSYRSFVRGKEINFSRKAINQLIGDNIIDRHDDEYEILLSGDVDTDEIVTDLCRPGATWTKDGQGRVKFIKKSDFTPIASVWCTFVQHTILPVNHHTEVIMKRALLVHCIMTSKWVNLGRIIARNIDKLAQEANTSLAYPALITKLCAKAGVDMSTDIPMGPDAPITTEVIKKVFRDFQRRGWNTEVEAQPKQPTHEKATAPSSSRTMSQRMDRMERRLNLHIRNSEMRDEYLIRCAQANEFIQRRIAEKLDIDPEELGGLPAPPDNLLDRIPFSEDEDDQQSEEEDEDND